MFWVLATALFACTMFGFIYPLCGVIYYKVIKHSKKSIREILDEL